MPGVERWKQSWVEGSTGWHQSDINKTLLSHKDQLFNGRNDLTVFVPLCGKTVDMAWFASLGHRVVGVEVSDLAITDFFKEQSMLYEKQAIVGLDGTVYTSSDGKVAIYCCDLFGLTRDLVGGVDAIWDRGSLVALDKADRKKYVEVLTSLLNKDGRWLTETFLYDSDKMTVNNFGVNKGPPQSISDITLNNIFNEKFMMVYLGNIDQEMPGYAIGRGLEFFHTRAHLLQHK